jgi:hypothetical protein
MSDKQDHVTPIKIDLGAKVSLDIKAEVPAPSVGRFVDALTDIIRPWTEQRGLKADLIRLHREEVAFQIAQRAAKRIEVENPQPHPIPLKTLIPLLEKGSQEEASDDFMIDMWANLLASSARETSVPPRYVGIIGELNGRQARLLVHISQKGEYEGSYEVQEHHLENLLTEIVKPKNCSAQDVADKVLPKFGYAGVYLTDLLIYTVPDGDQLAWHEEGIGIGSEIPADDLEVLMSLGLLQRVDIHRQVKNRKFDLITLHYYRMTDLAEDLLRVAMR